MHLRLCLVRIKVFSKNIPFSGNAIFRKGKCFYVFGCISKNFPKNIFWCLENATRKRQNQKNKHSTQIDARRSTGFDSAVLRELQSDDRTVDRNLAMQRAALRDRDRRRDLAKCQSRSTRRWDRDQRRDLAKCRLWSREALRRSRSAQRRVRDLGSRSTALVLANGANWTSCVQTAWTGFYSPSRALALSLQNSFEVKIGTEIHFRSQSLFFWVNGNQFPENAISQTNQTPAFPEMIFTQNKHSLKYNSKSTQSTQLPLLIMTYPN